MKTKNPQAAGAGSHSLGNQAIEPQSSAFGMPPLGAKFDRIKKHVSRFSRWRKPREGSSSSMDAAVDPATLSDRGVSAPYGPLMYPHAASDHPAVPIPVPASTSQRVLRSSTTAFSHGYSSITSSITSSISGIGTANSMYGFSYNHNSMTWEPVPAAAPNIMNVTQDYCNIQVLPECKTRSSEPYHENHLNAGEMQNPRSSLDRTMPEAGANMNSCPRTGQEYAPYPRKVPTFDEWWANAYRNSSKGSSRNGPVPSNGALNAISSQLSQMSCIHCRAKYNLKAADVITHIQKMLTNACSSKNCVTSGFKCSQCENFNCVACGLSIPTMQEHGSSASQRTLYLCCDAGRIMLIWALCCGVEDNEILSPPAAAQTGSGRNPFHIFKTSTKKHIGHTAHSSLDPTAAGSSTKTPPSKDHGKSNLASDTPFSGDAPGAKVTALIQPLPKGANPNGVGYGPGSNGTYFSASTSAKRIAEDHLYENYYDVLGRLLWPLVSGTPSSKCLDLLRQILSRSPLIAKASEYLRNTSIEDITKRYDLYMSLWWFLNILCDLPDLAVVATQPRILFTDEEQLARVCFAASDPTASTATLVENRKDKEKERELSESLAVLTDRIAEQCRFILQQSAHHSTDYEAGDGAKTVAMCRCFVNLSDRFASVLRLQPPLISGGQKTQMTGGHRMSTRASTRAQKANGLAEEKKRVEQEEEWHRDHRLSDVEDQTVMEDSYYRKHAEPIHTSPKGRMKRLINDVNILRTSLPEGIFVRHASSRLDVMKVMIVGPRGTPYENGLFEFDLFCPMDYPQSPPKMKLKTTGKGRVRFNPNLYRDGTVCLSLLGTWSGGNVWNPEHSTLLQVLVSIQAMVFCAEPYYNEPGRELKSSPAASALENASLRSHTVQYAMIYWLNVLSVGQRSSGDTSIRSQSPASPEMAVWEDVVRKHFELNAHVILQAAQCWGVPSQKIKDLTTALRRHSFLD